MSAGPDESLLIAFARAASKAQKIEALLQETVIGVEIVRTPILERKRRSQSDRYNPFSRSPSAREDRRSFDAFSNALPFSVGCGISMLLTFTNEPAR